jgi:hypothetical protein
VQLVTQVVVVVLVVIQLQEQVDQEKQVVVEQITWRTRSSNSNITRTSWWLYRCYIHSFWRFDYFLNLDNFV